MLYQNKNEEYFIKTNKQNSYWAGFIAADGYVSEDKNCLQVTLSAKDKDHLEKLKNELNKEYEIKIKKSNSSWATDESYYCAFSFVSKQTINNLKENWKLHQKKTYTLTFPKRLSVEEKKSYLCGYIDGDGCISVVKNSRGKIQLSINGNEDFLNGVVEFLKEEGKINIKNNTYESRNIFVFAVRGKVALSVLNFIYDESLPLMERKWDKYIHNKERKFGQYLLWAREEEELLKKKYKTLSSVEIHKEYFSNRSFYSVEKKIVEMGLTKRPQPQKVWSNEENQKFVEALENNLTTKNIYEILFPYRTFSSVKNQRRKLLQRG
jgi:hypothetical protein